MPSDQLRLRLCELPHDVLAELAAQLCSESTALQTTAEECLAAHKPLYRSLSLWAVERRLVSPDLAVPHIVGPLVAEDAAVCLQWLAGRHFQRHLLLWQLLQSS